MLVLTQTVYCMADELSRLRAKYDATRTVLLGQLARLERQHARSEQTLRGLLAARDQKAQTPAAKLLLETPDEVAMAIARQLDNPLDLLRLGIACFRFRMETVSAPHCAETSGTAEEQLTAVAPNTWSIVNEAARRWLVAQPEVDRKRVCFPLRRRNQFVVNENGKYGLARRYYNAALKSRKLSGQQAYRSTPAGTRVEAVETAAGAMRVCDPDGHSYWLEASRLTPSDDCWIGLMHELTQLQAPLRFSKADSSILLSDDGTTASIGHAIGRSSTGVACTGIAMRAGQHYAEFTIETGHQWTGDVYVGVIRPINQINGHMKDGECEQGSYMCDVKDGKLCDSFSSLSWQGRNTLSWGGMQAVHEGDSFGMLLDLGAGSLTAYMHDRRLGLVATGLTGEYVWAVSMFDGPSVRISSGPVPTSPTAEQLAADRPAQSYM